MKDLLDAVDLEGNQDSTEAVLRPVAVLIQVRCVVIPVLESKPRLGGAVSCVVAVIRVAGCRRIPFLVGHARPRGPWARLTRRLRMLFLGSLSMVILDRLMTVGPSESNEMTSWVDDAAVGASSATAGTAKPSADPTRGTTKRAFISPSRRIITF